MEEKEEQRRPLSPLDSSEERTYAVKMLSRGRLRGQVRNRGRTREAPRIRVLDSRG